MNTAKLQIHAFLIYILSNLHCLVYCLACQDILFLGKSILAILTFLLFAWATLQLKVIQFQALSFISCRLNDRWGFNESSEFLINTFIHELFNGFYLQSNVKTSKAVGLSFLMPNNESHYSSCRKIKIIYAKWLCNDKSKGYDWLI